MDKTILLISDRESFMTKAIQDNLKEAGFEVYFSTPSVNELSQSRKAPINLLYLGEYVEKAGEGLTFLKDKILEDEARLFIVGSGEEIKEARVFIPDAVITRTFERPLNVRLLVDAMNETSEIIEAEGDKKRILVVDDDPVMLLSFYPDRSISLEPDIIRTTY